MKKVFIVLACVICCTAVAQEKVKEVVSDNYDRNALSVVTVTRGDSEDATVVSVIEGLGIDDKFDANSIQTRTIDIPVARTVALKSTAVDSVVSKIDFGKEILSFIFKRTPDGMMTDELILYRGKYNATDQDVINARASKIGVEALGETGHDLVSSSYILFVDYPSITSSKDKNGKDVWSTKAYGYVYKIYFPVDVLNDFYEKTWIYDDDTEDVKQEKRAAFDSYSVKMKPVTSVSCSGSGESKEEAIADAYPTLIMKLENKIPEWNVTSSVYAVKPIQAKIGKKEGLKNADRYRAYSYKEDKDGKIVSVKRGYVRATEVTDNKGMSTGASSCSKFYQISGNANIQEGMTIKQSNDWKLGVAIAPKFGTSGFSFNVDFDYIAYMSNNGNTTYGLLSIGSDFTTLAHNVSNVNAAVGAGYGFKIIRPIEVMPYAMVGTDYLTYSEDTTEDSDETFSMKSAYYGEAGVRLGFNVFYPLQVYAKLCYDLYFSKGVIYDYYNSYLSTQHRSGIGAQIGIKWTF